MISGEVAASNYSFYKLSAAGYVRLSLVSLEGDADLYVSSKTNNPTYSLDSHEMKADSCGIDVLDIPSEAAGRPLWISVYGYPSHELSRFVLTVTLWPLPTRSDSDAASSPSQSGEYDSGGERPRDGDASDSNEGSSGHERRDETGGEEDEPDSRLLQVFEIVISLGTLLFELLLDVLL